MPRPATSSDFEAILRLAAHKVYPTWPSQDPRDSGLSFLQKLLDPGGRLSEFEFLVSEDSGDLSGFLVLEKRFVRGFTGDRESVIHDYYGRDLAQVKGLLEGAAQVARDQDSTFLTIQLSPQDVDTRELLETRGFQLESHRLSVASGTPALPRDTPYAVRLATEDDAFLIGILNSTLLHHTLPPGREYDLGELTLQSMGAVMTHAVRQDPHCANLVLTFGGEVVGHLLLELNDRMGYVYDLALAQEHWGGIGVRHLMREGSRLLYERNIPLFVGDISASNRRAWLVVQRTLGFQVDCSRFGLKLGGC